MNKSEINLLLNSLNADKYACRNLASGWEEEENSALGRFRRFMNLVANHLEKAEETIDILSKSCYCSIDEWKEVNDMSVARKKPAPLWEEVNDMSDKAEAADLIEEYSKLIRIKNAEDREKELDYWIKIVKAKLEAFGIVVEDLGIE